MGIKVAASLWSADLLNLRHDIKKVENLADRFHVDIMDNHYVKNLLFGPDFIKAVKKITTKPIEVHLMLEQVDKCIDEYISIGSDYIILHNDTVSDLNGIIKKLKEKKVKSGLALKVEEDYLDIIPHLKDFDIIVLMGTKLGIKGADFETTVYKKIKQIATYIKDNNLSIEIQIDGGIRMDTVPEMIQNGAQIITAGSFLFDDPIKFRRWKELR